MPLMRREALSYTSIPSAYRSVSALPSEHQREELNTPEFVRELFNEMARTYGIVNVVSSFGFCLRWRRQCLESAHINPHDIVCDLMSGTGELWPSIVGRLRHAGRISAVDLSPAMAAQA